MTYAIRLVCSLTWDDIIGGICLLVMFWGLPWIAAFAEYVVTP